MYWIVENSIANKSEATKIQDIESDEDVMEIDEFVLICKNRGFIDYDGHGCLAFDGKKTDVYILPSQVEDGLTIPKWATHVVWYNK